MDKIINRSATFQKSEFCSDLVNDISEKVKGIIYSRFLKQTAKVRK